MFTLDERVRGLPAQRDQVAALYQSINTPHLAIPGKQAGPAQAFIVGVRTGGGFNVFVYLHLAEASDCAVYLSDRRNLSPDQYREEESEALGFVESMGFMMDNANFRTLAPADQDELIKTLPVFQKDPKLGGVAKPAPAKEADKVSPQSALTKLFTAFSLLCLLLGGNGCRHIPDDRTRQGAQIHYDLGVQAQQAGDNQGAYREYEMAVQMDPSLAEAHNALGILLHLVFRKPDEAVGHYQQALSIRPTFSEVKVNLANVHLSEERYDAAIKLYEEALNDMMYPTPYIAQNNLGWAQFKKGQASLGLENIKAAVTLNPKFCQGFRNLALIYEAEGDSEGSCREWRRFGDACPDQPEPVYRRAMCLVKQGDRDGARKAFSECVNTVKQAVVKEDCRLQLEQMSGRATPPR